MAKFIENKIIVKEAQLYNAVIYKSVFIA